MNYTFSNPIVHFKECMRSPISYSWLRNKTKWMNKRRLYKKFEKNASQIYGVPVMIMATQKAVKQIEEDVDADIIKELLEHA